MEEETMTKGAEIGGAVETLVGGAPDEGAASVEPLPTAAKDSDSSESESEDEGAQELKIGALEKALAVNPMDYDSHVQYIHTLRKLGHIEKLRLARESMNLHFPLSPQMWQEWTKDEASLSASSEGFVEIEKLFERGVSEYLSVPLWCDYLEFVEEHDPLVCQCAPAGLSKMRNLFESALTACGLHISEGNKVWEAYREFEQAILLTIDDSNSEEKSKQVQRIRSLFHRQLSVPSVDLRSTMKAYKHWENEQGNANDSNSELDGVPDSIASSYRKALEMYNARSVYEDQLSSCDRFYNSRREYYTNYIKYEESTGNPARVQILYERALSDFPVTSDLWLGYTSYLDRTLKISSVLKSVYSRATRNCLWVGDLWVRYLLSLERIHASEKELSDVFEQSMRCVFPSYKEYMELFLTRVDGLRRRICFIGSDEDKLEYGLIRETFQRAVDYLYPLVSPDVLLDLHAYWAHLEANLGKDLVAARGVWEGLIKRSGSFLEVWQSYIAMEIEMGNVSEARCIYKRCYNKRFFGAGSEDICHSWLRFERKYGTLDELDLAVKKVTPRLNELMMFKAQQESKTSIPISAKIESSVANNPKKRKTAKLSSDKPPIAKKQKNIELKSVGSSSPVPTKKPGNTSDRPTLPKAVDTGPLNGKKIGDPKLIPSKPAIYTDECTAFVTNLSHEATKKHLEEFFSDCGVTDVRILKDKNTGKSRGLAYADFLDDAHLASAIAKDGQKLLGKKLNIARSDPKNRKKSSSSSLSRGQEGRMCWINCTSTKGQNAMRNNSMKGKRKNLMEAGVLLYVLRQFSCHTGKDVKENVAKLADVDNVQSPSNKEKFVGKNTFAAPRALVRPLGWQSKKEKAVEDKEIPKSNNEFRDMLLKK